MYIRTLLAALALTFSLAFGQGTPEDDRLFDQVRLKLAADRDIGGEVIQVSVHQKIVTLKGKVARDKQKSRAEQLAKKVKGVEKVVNEIEVQFKSQR